MKTKIITHKKAFSNSVDMDYDSLKAEIDWVLAGFIHELRVYGDEKFHLF